MAAIDFEERDLYATVPDPSRGGAWVSTRLRWRRDPLTGAGSRLLTGAKLRPTSPADVSGFRAPVGFCPFDAENLEATTFPFPRAIAHEGRIRRGAAVVVPNVLAYATHSAVGIYDPDTHFMDLDGFTPPVVADALCAMVQHATAVRRIDPGAVWSSISANHLPPAGSSLVHPHLQSAHDAYGLTTQRTLLASSRAWSTGQDSYWATLVRQEDGGPRWIGRTGPVTWLTPFAPSGFHEVWGLVQDVDDVPGLSEHHCRALGSGLSRVLRAYHSLNLASFNFAIIGGGPQAHEAGYQLLVKVVSRSNPEPMYRSDATFFERLHGEALIDTSPEDVATALRQYFD